ncbi:MAG: hypothetical protein OEM83_07885 [Gammaproteobacteria bacterium]|nr:hypothetical protein [Gammaproteobacteria bacterium]MDH5511716.1 hypothetical protein [Gammaproteobacteria bacterium]
MSLKKEIGLLLGVGVAAAVIFGPSWWRPAVPCLAGDMTARARAQVPGELKDIYLDAQEMQFGLGSAAVGGWEGLGDAVVVGGVAWVRTTHYDSPNYFSTVSNRYFQTNGFAFIPHAGANGIPLRLEQSTSLQELWNSLAEKYPEGVMLSGYLRLAPLRIIAMARPAIDGRPVNKNAPHYYTRPMESAAEAWAYVAGFAITWSSSDRRDRAWLASMLTTRDRNSGPGTGLAHVLWLDSAPDDRQQPPRRETVKAVGRLVADATSIMEGEIRLYPLTRAGGCHGAAQVRGSGQ